MSVSQVPGQFQPLLRTLGATFGLAVAVAGKTAKMRWASLCTWGHTMSLHRALMLSVGLLLIVGSLGCGDKPEPVVEVVAEPEPVAEDARENSPGPVAEPEQVVEVEIVAEPEPVAEDARENSPGPVAEPKPVAEPAVVVEPEPVAEEAKQSPPEPVAEPKPVAEPAVVAEPEPVVEEAKQSPPGPEFGRDVAIAALIEMQGSRVVYDEESPERPVVEINLYRSEAGDADLVHLKGLTSLHKLDLGKNPGHRHWPGAPEGTN